MSKVTNADNIKLVLKSIQDSVNEASKKLAKNPDISDENYKKITQILLNASYETTEILALLKNK